MIKRSASLLRQHRQSDQGPHSTHWKTVDRQTILKSLSASLGDLLEVVREAGERILDVYSHDFDVVLKSDLSPLTLADQRAHEILFERLPRILAVPVLSEEGRAIGYTERAAWTTFWSADPLDGTREFVKKSGDFCVSVGLVHEARPLFGVIYIPLEDRIYFGGREFGAFALDGKNSAALHRHPAHTILSRSTALGIDREPSDREWVLIGSASHGSELPGTLLSRLNKKHPFSAKAVGSAIKFCRIADGSADFYPRTGTTMEWDTAAGQAIVEATGGGLISIGDRRPLLYNKEHLENPDFYCYGRRFAEEFPELLSPGAV